MTDHHDDDARAADAGDAGFTLVEVVVAMVLLAVLAVATLPLFMTGIRVSADDSARTTATAQIASLIEEARASAPTCTKLKALSASHQGVSVPTNRGRKLLLTMQPPTCTSGAAAPVPITIKATGTAADGSAAVSSVSTIIYVTS